MRPSSTLTTRWFFARAVVQRIRRATATSSAQPGAVAHWITPSARSSTVCGIESGKAYQGQQNIQAGPPAAIASAIMTEMTMLAEAVLDDVSLTTCS